MDLGGAQLKQEIPVLSFARCVFVIWSTFSGVIEMDNNIGLWWTLNSVTYKELSKVYDACSRCLINCVHRNLLVASVIVSVVCFSLFSLCFPSFFLAFFGKAGHWLEYLYIKPSHLLVGEMEVVLSKAKSLGFHLCPTTAFFFWFVFPASECFVSWHSGCLRVTRNLVCQMSFNLIRTLPLKLVLSVGYSL